MTVGESVERSAYVARLLSRVISLTWEASPEGLGKNDQFWEDLAPVDDVFEEAQQAYIAGEIDKDELDEKAIGYLNHWRELCKTLTIPSTP